MFERLLWPLLAAYTVWLTWHGYAELRAEHHVQGLYRSYAHPYPIEGGWVIDPRPGDLLAEVRNRYARGHALPEPAPRTPAEWRAVLATLGLSVEEARGLGDLQHPRVLFGDGGPLLLLGAYARDPIAFDPARGVLRLAKEALPADAPALVLVGAREAPW